MALMQKSKVTLFQTGESLFSYTAAAIWNEPFA